MIPEMIEKGSCARDVSALLRILSLDGTDCEVVTVDRKTKHPEAHYLLELSRGSNVELG